MLSLPRYTYLIELPPEVGRQLESMAGLRGVDEEVLAAMLLASVLLDEPANGEEPEEE